jgi:hypothetical protein
VHNLHSPEQGAAIAPCFLYKNQIMDQRINEIIDDAKAYTAHQLELVKLEAAEKTARISSELLTYLILGVIGFILLLFASIACGFLIGNALNSVAYGFLTVAGFYMLILIILILGKNQLLKKQLMNFSIKKMFEDAE